MSRRQGASYSPHPTYMHSPFVLRTAGKEYETVKLYLSADIEGTAGIDTWDETEIGKEKYAYFARQMTREVSAAVEGAEDSAELGKEDMLKLALTENDTLVGIAASGRTPYVLGAMKAARDAGAGVIGLTCCPGSEIERAADIGISPDPGPEVITGSTRMKCGTAQKMVLNMLSTCTMVKLGKVYGNLMVDVKPSNEKLVHRCISIVREATGADEKTAVAALEECGYKCKTAIVMLLCSVSADEAEARLGRSDGRVADAIR